MARSKTAPAYTLRCQFCNSSKNRVKNLDMEHVCRRCGKFAKYRFQKLEKITVLDRSNGKIIDVYQVLKVSKPCTSCGELVPIDLDCLQCVRVRHDSARI